MYSSDSIEIQDVHFSYRLAVGSPIPALCGLSLTITGGEYLTVLGRNGSGKSTLARLLNGLLLPTSGQVLVGGLDTRRHSNQRTIRRSIGLVFQSPDNQLIANTVEEDVAFGPENIGVSPDELEKRVRWALEVVGMWEHRTRPPHMLSAGQKQRVAIAGVLAMRPRHLVLDEATAMLDPAGRRDVLHIVSDLHRAGTTVVAITHHVSEALLADRVAILDHGRLLHIGAPGALLTREKDLRSVGLEAPPVVRLVQELRYRGMAVTEETMTGTELADALLRLRAESRR